jgi:hypothetical protein
VTLDCVVMGDYGVGVADDLESSRRQRRVADVLDRLVDRGDVRLIVGGRQRLPRAARAGG